MTQAELIKCLSGPFYENFANQAAQRVREADAVELLYATVVAAHAELSGTVRHKVLFRSAYVLEKIYFTAPDEFSPYADSFCRDAFPACRDKSARRHFAKIMADLLLRYTPEFAVLERIAETAAQWAVEPEAKVAVRIWAVEVLKCCKEQIDWVAETWEDLVEMMALNATPGVNCRLRKSWRK